MIEIGKELADTIYIVSLFILVGFYIWRMTDD